MENQTEPVAPSNEEFIYKVIKNNMIYDGILQGIAYRILTKAVDITPELNGADVFIHFEDLLKDKKPLPEYDLKVKNISLSSLSGLSERLDDHASLISTAIKNMMLEAKAKGTKLVHGTLRVALVPATGTMDSGFNVALKLMYLETTGDSK